MVAAIMKPRTMFLAGLAAGAVLGLSGCESPGDKADLSTFTPAGAGTWRYEADAGSSGPYAVASEAGEASRLRWLKEDVIANRACPPNGAYRVVSRTPVLQHTTLIGVEIWKVVYEVECG